MQTVFDGFLLNLYYDDGDGGDATLMTLVSYMYDTNYDVADANDLNDELDYLRRQSYLMNMLGKDDFCLKIKLKNIYII